MSRIEEMIKNLPKSERISFLETMIETLESQKRVAQTTIEDYTNVLLGELSE